MENLEDWRKELEKALKQPVRDENYISHCREVIAEIKGRKEMRVYLIDVDSDHYKEWVDLNTDKHREIIIRQAEDHGEVYSLKGFQNALNDGSLNITGYFVYITEIEV